MSADFHMLVMDLLYDGALPLPRSDGYRGDPYLSSEDYQALCNIVCEAVPGMTVADWDAMDEGRRTACLRTVVEKKAPATIAAPDGVPAEYREDGQISGEPLTRRYLINDEEWGVTFKNSAQFTRLTEKGKLTNPLSVGRTFAYLYTECCAIVVEDSKKPERDR